MVDCLRSKILLVCDSSCKILLDPKERCKFSPKTYIYIFFDSEWEYDSGESDLELTSHPLCGHRKGIRFLFIYKWLYFNFISTKVSRCCFIEQHFIIFRKFSLSKSFCPVRTPKKLKKASMKPFLLYAISNLQIYLNLLCIKLNYYTLFFFSLRGG